MKELKNYLHLYLGCRVLRPDMKTVLTISGISGSVIHFLEEGKGETYGSVSLAKPILRKLSSITEEEYIFCKKKGWADGAANKFSYTSAISVYEPDEFLYLLSLHIDLFNLIPESLAIDASTLKQ